MEMQNDPLTTESLASSLPASVTSQPRSTSQRSLQTDSVAIRYHVISTPRDSDGESGIVHTSRQLNVSGATRSTGDVSTVRNTQNQFPEDRRRRNKYRRRRNRIGLLLVFATLLLFAGLVVCANTREYLAGATISVIGVLLGSSSMVLCLVTTDSCDRVHGIRERVSSFSRSNHSRGTANHRRARRGNGDGAFASVSAANSSLNVQDTMVVHTLPPTAVCNISGDFLDHLPPPTYETAEILLREDLARDQGYGGDTPGAVGGRSDYHQYYKVSQAEAAAATPTASVTNLAAASVSSPSTSHLCDECVHRQQSIDPTSNASAPAPEEHVLVTPAIVVELPTYDEAIAEDKDS